INGWSVAEGVGFEESGDDKVERVGETSRRELFGDESGIGETIRIGRVPLTVVGTLAPKGQSSWGRDQDEIVMVPLETARRRLMGAMGMPPGAVMEISLAVDDPDDLGYVQGEIESLLRQRHRIAPGAEDDFRVRNMSEIVATAPSSHDIMLVSVT